MVCNAGLRKTNIVDQTDNPKYSVSKEEKQIDGLDRAQDKKLGVRCQKKQRNIVPSAVKMLVDTSLDMQRRPATGAPSEIRVDEGGYISGGWKSEEANLSCGYSSFRGKRASMEDFFDAKTMKFDGQTISLFGVFDGHGGSRAAEYLREHLFENLIKHPQFLTDTKLAISETYKRTDCDFLDAESNSSRDDGSTASTAVLVGEHLYVANVGDSRVVISKAGKATALSDDHKPNRSDERKRIEKAGGVVMWAGTWRVGGVLAMSRAFGNRLLKQFVVADPEIQEEVVDNKVELLVLASDGLWDVVKNEDAVFLARMEEEPEAAARRLTETAFSRGSTDNITCVVVRFSHHDKVDIHSPEAVKVESPDKVNANLPDEKDEDSTAEEGESSTSQVVVDPAPPPAVTPQD